MKKRQREPRQAVERLDLLLADLYARLRALPGGEDINFIVTSDHGMAPTSPQRIIRLSDYLQPDWCERVLADLPTLIFPKAGHEDDILKALERVPHLRVWRREDVPAYLRYGSNPNVAPIVALPDNGWLVSEDGRVNLGNHGFDPTASDLCVPFRAEGPDFKHGYVRTALFDNTCIYPLLAHLLGIEPAPCDGSVGQVSDLLEP
ncbi:alkaline phosphatase family protein [Mediterranea massiliensis]|uniref:alkaline phosphatase family protein n=1 Tax=Mediterranea massiliensis TaxID=1841865 RepID=UPI000AC61CF8|nr:alkaline phosphatase family protein [Mediterranea massiliensis]